MTRRTNRCEFLLKVIVLVAVVMAIPGCVTSTEESSPEAVVEIDRSTGQWPNILYIMADDHSADAISCYGGVLSEIYKTPNIDRIAAGGARLDNCFVTNSISAPSRTSILTGQYSHVNGVYTSADRIKSEKQNVAKMLQQSGYQTGIFGKWGLWNEPTGFDHYRVMPEDGRYNNPLIKEKQQSVEWVPGRVGVYRHEGYSSEMVADVTLDWLKKRDTTKPFFAMCHFKATEATVFYHGKYYEHLRDGVKFPQPATLMDDYSNRSQAAKQAKLRLHGEDIETRQRDYQRYIRKYILSTRGIDENVGRLLDWLDKEGLAENTIVIYTADQGNYIGEHGYAGSELMYDGAIRVPFVIRYPKEIEAGSVNDDITLNVDYAPTFLDFAGLTTPKDMQGQSIRANLTGQTPADWRSSMYYRYWLHLRRKKVPAHYGVRTKQHKLIFYYGLPLDANGSVDEPTTPEWELFDLEKDPHEMNNVYGDPAYKDVAKQLKEELLQLKKELGDKDKKYPELMKVRKKYWK
ncbi:MAG: sulfatase family protein [Planctomycetota bacterium]|jgi:arylsulfatase A-like enzyme